MSIGGCAQISLSRSFLLRFQGLHPYRKALLDVALIGPHLYILLHIVFCPHQDFIRVPLRNPHGKFSSGVTYRLPPILLFFRASDTQRRSGEREHAFVENGSNDQKSRAKLGRLGGTWYCSLGSRFYLRTGAGICGGGRARFRRLLSRDSPRRTADKNCE